MGITGPAGAGKTTLCHCLNGVIPHYRPGRRRGKVRLGGTPVEALSLSDLGRRVGTVFEDPDFQMVSETVEEEVAFGPEHLGLPPERIQSQVEEALEALEIRELRKRVISTLSGGEKQRVAIAASLAARPPILVLDEPTSELDPVGTAEVFQALTRLNREYAVTVILVSQEVEFLATHAEELIVLDSGAGIARGSPEEVFEDPTPLERSGIAIPAVVRLAKRLQDEAGLTLPNGRIPLGVEAAADLLGFIPAAPSSASPRLSEDRGVATATPKSATLAVECAKLSFRFPNGFLALNEISLSVAAGEFVAIIGHNGSGKTTFAKHLNGLLRATSGTVRIAGESVGRRRVSQLARQVGYVFQNPDHQIFNPTVAEEVAFGPRNLGLSIEESEVAVRGALEAVELTGLEGSSPADLSKGQRQRLAVASILAMNPEVLVIDEPTTGQDYREGRSMMLLARKLNGEGRTVLFITHDMGLVAEFAHRVLVFGEGRLLLDDTPREVFGAPELLRKAGLRPPQITRLGHRLPDRMPGTVLSVEEAFAALASQVGSA